MDVAAAQETDVDTGAAQLAVDRGAVCREERFRAGVHRESGEVHVRAARADVDDVTAVGRMRSSMSVTNSAFSVFSGVLNVG
nr:hypothetical protein [Sphaerisporangium perillae]